MKFSVRSLTAALGAVALCAAVSTARAGDDGAAPIWEGIGSIVSPLLGVTDLQSMVGFGQKEEKPQIQYREHGKLVVPKSLDLPAPGAAPVAAEGGAWPVNQEDARKKARKEAAAKKQTHGTTDALNRQPFPNAPVTVRAADQEGPLPGACPEDKCKSTGSQVLGALNPFGWLGGSKSSNGAPPPEPDRDWLTDPPKGYRAPAGQVSNN
jgi:hypothetical protein